MYLCVHLRMYVCIRMDGGGSSNDGGVGGRTTPLASKRRTSPRQVKGCMDTYMQQRGREGEAEGEREGKNQEPPP